MDEDSPSSGVNPDSPSPSILVVDDEANFRISLERILSSRGFHVETAAGGREAKQKLQDPYHNYDLILLDLMMPEVNGHQVLKFISQTDLDVATVVVSGTTSVTEATTAMRYGAQDYLHKPYDIDQLLICVQRAIWSQELKRENQLMQARLRRSEHLHSFLVNNSPDLIFALDDQGCITFVNDRFRSLLGLARESLIGRPFSSLVHHEERTAFDDYLQDILLNRAVRQTLDTRLVNPADAVSDSAEDSIQLPCHIRVTVIDDTPTHRGIAEKAIGIYGTARDQTERNLSEERIRRLAYYDPLTGLPNRQLFQDRLEQALQRAQRSGHALALLFLDLDKFKYTNDTLGHHAGDLLLKEVSNRLLKLFRRQDSVSRISGDEFIVVLEQIKGGNDAGVVAQKVLESLEEPFLIDQNTLHVSASIGISIFPQDGQDQDTLLKHADVAMYRAKEKGRNNYQFFTAEMTHWMRERVEMKSRLANALKEDQLLLYFQPQFELKSGRLVGAEALVRWNDPEQGLLLPERFLTVAEESGLILPLGKWVLREACRRAKSWQDMGLPLQRICVNLSTKQVLSADIVQSVEEILEETGLSSNSLELEITERFLLEPNEGIVRALKDLHQLGVSFSVDDFGTGYSSLSILKHLPIDKLKIDSSSIRDMSTDHNENAIIRAILAMGERLKIQISAEGVETVAQDGFLRNEGCNEVQGYLYQPPLPEPEMTALLSNLRPALTVPH